MKIAKTLRFMGLAGIPLALLAQGLDPALLKKPATDSWPTYHGDYSGRHYSTLDQINRSNVNRLTLQWTAALDGSTTGPLFGGEHKDGDPVWVYRGYGGGVRVSAEALQVNGQLYVTSDDHAWALDARTGRQLWHYYWKSSGGTHIVGNRGFGMYGNWLFFETPDCYLVSLDAATGKERWHKQIADVRQFYFCTPAPIVVKNHVLAGMGGDSLDLQGSLQSFDPETGALQWKWYTTPQNPGDPGWDTWPDEYARKHGGGMTWQPPTYDPDLNLIYVATGNPNPVGATQSRKGDNLYTCSLVALNPDTGKMAWYFQTSPHDSHDWDSTEVPVLFDGVWNGKPRKLVAQATRNGYFFVLDRVTGEHLLTKPLVDPEYITWSMGIDAKGRPISNPKKEPSVDGVLVGPGSATNWQPPSFSPESGLFYVGTSEGFGLEYLVDTSERPEGYGFTEGAGGSAGRSGIRAIDYKTGVMKWFHEGGSARGLLSTAGHLLFGGDGHGYFSAFDQDTGKTLWHTAVPSGSTNGPQTFLLDGRQVILVANADTLYCFTLSN
ncbi:MAG TPA: acido-empty-quinoprotein group A [Bryobacteraceae bacterium]